MQDHNDKILLLKALGAQVRALRLRARLTNKEFAAGAWLSPRFLIQLESGHANICGSDRVVWAPLQLQNRKR